MATLFEWDGGALPTIVGSAPTVSGTDMTFAASASAAYASWAGLSINAYTLRFYVVVPSAWASASWGLAHAMLTATPNARINLAGAGSPGQVRFLRSGNVQIANTPTNAVALSGTYRIEWQVDRAAQTYRGAIFPLGSDAPLYDTGPLTAVDTGASPFTALQLGRVTAQSTAALTVGRIKAVDTVGAWVGRHASDPITAGTEVLGLWTGSVINPAVLLGLWTGSVIEPVSLAYSESESPRRIIPATIPFTL